MGPLRNPYNVLCGICEPVGRLGAAGRIILKRIFKKCVKMWTVFLWFRIGASERLVCTTVLNV
jgi:hypothetical protein